MRFHEKLNLEKFWIQWFGNYGRELGSNVKHSFGIHPKGYEEAHRMFTESYNDYLLFVKWCNENNHACWITSQPFRKYGMPFGFEKIVFDFDYPLKDNHKMTEKRKEKVSAEMIEFVNHLDCEPLIVETYKGFHVDCFLRRIYEFNESNLEFSRDVFGTMAISIAGIENKLFCQMNKEDRNRWKYLDWAVAQDIMRMARVPLTRHEKSGEICQVIDVDLKPTKIRSLSFYRGYGIREDKIRDAVETVKEYCAKELERKRRKIQSGANEFDENGREYGSDIRPCFKAFLNAGEMKHQHRLAFLIEAYYKGYKEEDQLVDLCRGFKDFDEKKTRYYVRYFLNHNPSKYPPYRCKTIESYNWCIGNMCHIWRKHNSVDK